MMEIQPEAKPIYLIGLDTSAQYDRKRKTDSQNFVFSATLTDLLSFDGCRMLKLLGTKI